MASAAIKQSWSRRKACSKLRGTKPKVVLDAPVEVFTSEDHRRKVEAAKLRRAVNTLRKQMASKGIKESTLNLKAKLLGVYDEGFSRLTRADRHSKVAAAFSKRLTA